jgi:hypothetical protein
MADARIGRLGLRVGVSEMDGEESAA